MVAAPKAALVALCIFAAPVPASSQRPEGARNQSRRPLGGLPGFMPGTSMGTHHVHLRPAVSGKAHPVALGRAGAPTMVGDVPDQGGRPLFLDMLKASFNAPDHIPVNAMSVITEWEQDAISAEKQAMLRNDNETGHVMEATRDILSRMYLDFAFGKLWQVFAFREKEGAALQALATLTYQDDWHETRVLHMGGIVASPTMSYHPTAIADFFRRISAWAAARECVVTIAPSSDEVSFYYKSLGLPLSEHSSGRVLVSGGAKHFQNLDMVTIDY